MFKLFALAAALGLATAVGAAPPAPQAATPPAAKGMNYDCTKAGNKTKAACKNVTPAAVAIPAKPAAAPMAAKPAGPAAKPAAATPAKPMNYDCTKAGNANKAVCKNVVVPPKTAMAPAAPAPAKPMMPAPAMAPAKSRAAAAPKAMGPNEVTATLKNGKTVHYDCAKAGNKEKKACGAK